MMSRWLCNSAACAILAAAMLAAPVYAEDQSTSPLVKQINNGNWLPQQEAESLRDEKNDGLTNYALNVKDNVPVDGFWSISVYNAEGFEPPPRGSEIPPRKRPVSNPSSSSHVLA